MKIIFKHIKIGSYGNYHKSKIDQGVAIPVAQFVAVNLSSPSYSYPTNCTKKHLN